MQRHRLDAPDIQHGWPSEYGRRRLGHYETPRQKAEQRVAKWAAENPEGWVRFEGQYRRVGELSFEEWHKLLNEKCGRYGGR